jgi:hypothetical protein
MFDDNIKPWFDDSLKNRRHDQVFATVQTLRNQQQTRLKDLERYRLLYGDDDTNGYLNSIGSLGNIMRGNGRQRSSESLIRAVVDTITSKLGVSPKPFVVSSGGDGALRRKGKGLNKFLLGKWDQLQVKQRLRSLLRDAAIFGTGAVKILVDTQIRDLSLERTNIAQLFVDPSECQFGQKPTQMFQVIPGNKRLMMQLYPKHAVALKTSAPPTQTSFNNSRTNQPVLVDQVELVECWKLPDNPDEPGRHTICASNCTLVDEEWTDTDFPFVFLHYSEPITGFWGDGLAKLLMECQLQAHYASLSIAETIRLCSNAVWLVSEKANIPASHFNTRGVGDVKVLYYRGEAPPQLVSFSAVSKDAYQFLADNRTRAFEIAGVSQLSAESKKPPGDLSGVALDSLNDSESTRMLSQAKNYEQAAMDIAERIINLTQQEYEKGDPDVMKAMFKAYYSRSWDSQTVKWSQVNMHRDQFSLNIWPISELLTTPSGKMQKVQDWLAQGMISSDDARELLDVPDTDRWSQLKDVGHENAERLVESVLYEDADPVVEKYHDVQYMLTYCQNLYNQCQLNDADEETLERLRQLMDQCQEFMDAAAPPAPAPGPPPPPPPPTQGVPQQ